MVTKRLVGLLAGVIALTSAVACGEDGSSPVTATPTGATSTGTPTPAATAGPRGLPAAGGPVVHKLDLPTSITATEGTQLVSSSADATLRGWSSDDVVGTSPAAAYGDVFVVQKAYLKHSDGQPTEFERWDSKTGEFRHLWTVAPGKQNAFTVGDGAWLATVETGYSLPLQSWDLLLRNADSGETLKIASSDDRVPGLARGVQLGPAGFAPLPAIWAQRVVWAEFFVTTENRLGKRIQMYEISSKTTTTLVELTDATTGDLESPSLGGNNFSWLTWDANRTPGLMVRNLATGSEAMFQIGGDPYSSALSSDGKYVAWDDTQYAQRGTRAKYALNLETESVVRYAETRGWGTYVAGSYVSWSPWENAAGFYDMTRKTVHRVELNGATTVYATVMGGWYFWQESRDTGVGIEGSESIYYFHRLD